MTQPSSSNLIPRCWITLVLETLLAYVVDKVVMFVMAPLLELLELVGLLERCLFLGTTFATAIFTIHDIQIVIIDDKAKIGQKSSDGVVW